MNGKDQDNNEQVKNLINNFLKKHPRNKDTRELKVSCYKANTYYIDMFSRDNDSLRYKIVFDEFSRFDAIQFPDCYYCNDYKDLENIVKFLDKNFDVLSEIANEDRLLAMEHESLEYLEDTNSEELENLYYYDTYDLD